MTTRPHNRTTILTTSKKMFEKVCNLKDGQAVTIECPNDIVSSARGGSSKIHHSVRRASLVRRLVCADLRRVRVRYEQGYEIACVIHGDKVVGDEDASVFRVTVKK